MPDEHGKISIFGVTLDRVPMPVMVAAIGVLLVGANALVYYKTVHDPEFALITQKEANRALQASVNEYGLHIAETPETSAVLFDDKRGRSTAQGYSDGCIVLARTRNGRVRSKLIVDLDRDEHPSARLSLPSFVAPVEAAGRCLVFHQGKFETWYGEKRGCYVQIFRRWPDGCEHWQWFDTCHGVFDSNQDGSPKVTWTSCVH